MPEKPKRKPESEMSRRRFLQLGIATAGISLATAITSRWMTQRTESTPQVENCAYSWASNTTRLNEQSSTLLQEALLADGLTPAQAEVYDRAMEYKTCYDAEGNILSQDLLYRDNESALVVFAVEALALNEDTHASRVEDVLETLSCIETFYVQDVEVQLTDGEASLIWQAPFYAIQQTTNVNEIYNTGRNPQP